MISKLREQVKAANTRHDALENIHIELQNLKIQLINKGYKVITIPGGPGPSFEENLDTNQTFNSADKELVEYYEVVRALKKAADNVGIKKIEQYTDSIQNEILSILESKP